MTGVQTCALPILERKPEERWMQLVVKSGPESRPTVAGNTLSDSGSTLIGPWDSLAKLEDFGQGRKREQQKTIQPMGIRVSGSKSYHDSCSRTNTSTPSISFATLSNRDSSWVFTSSP